MNLSLALSGIMLKAYEDQTCHPTRTCAVFEQINCHLNWNMVTLSYHGTMLVTVFSFLPSKFSAVRKAALELHLFNFTTSVAY